MSKILEHFKTISAIPRCSYKADMMKEKIINFSKDLGFEVTVDKVGNILCKKGNPSICLQAHYDMVCIGDTHPMELVQVGSILSAKNSTLGADNGMGMAMMFSCMEKFEDIECLFTSDEEVGLIGASNLELTIHSSKLLNLDGEHEGDIYIGCVGGVYIVSELSLEYLPLHVDEYIYEISAENLRGGHSGIDIDKGIDSAIKVLAKELVGHDVKLLHVEGGEFRNSISKNAKAIVSSKEKIILKNNTISIKPTQFKREYIKNGDLIIKALDAFSQGVRSYNTEFMIPSVSINLGLIKIVDGIMRVNCAPRALDDDDLFDIARQIESFFDLAGFTSHQKDFHGAWVPNIGKFANNVKNVMSKKSDNVKFSVIAGGIECGILMKKQSKPMEAVSIGPTIRYPHSTREECDLDSVERINEVVEELLGGI